MENKISKIFIFLFLFVSLIACCCLTKVKVKNDGTSMFGYEKIINGRQLDSIITVDTLNPFIDEWLTMTFYEYETNVPVKQRMFIKELTDSTEVIYVLVEKDSLYLITKRIVKND